MTAQASPRHLRMVAGRLARLDPILSRSLVLAGFGLGLLALGRALGARGGPVALTVDNPTAQLRCGHSDIPCPGDVLPSH